MDNLIGFSQPSDHFAIVAFPMKVFIDSKWVLTKPDVLVVPVCGQNGRVVHDSGVALLMCTWYITSAPASGVWRHDRRVHQLCQD